METRANYVLIGAFTLLALVGGLGFFVWLARLELDRQFAYYDILFDNVSGLTRGGEVRFNGVNVGTVLFFDFYDEDPSLVQVRIEIRADTPVTEETEAQLQLQGVTGISFVSLTSERSDLPLLTDTTDGVPLLRGRPSRLDELLGEAPDLVTESLALLQQLTNLVSGENQQYFQNILRNVEAASARLESGLDDFAGLSADVANAASEIAAFTGRLEVIGTEASRTLDTADAALTAATGTFSTAEVTFAAATETLAELRTTLASASRVLDDQVPGIVDRLDTFVAETGGEVRGAAAGVNELVAAAGARVAEAEATIAAANAALRQSSETLEAVGAAAQRFDGMLEQDGAPLVAEAREAVAAATETLAAARRVADEDVPGIVADVRGAAETVNRVADQVGSDVTGFTGRLDGLAGEAGTALAAATDTFRSANSTLGAIDEALAAADATLTTAERAFAGAERVIDEEAAAALADFRSAAAALEAAVGEITADVPALVADIRSAVGNAEAAMATLDDTIERASPQVIALAETGLPQFTRLMQEARSLAASLERLTQRIDRDPARFFFGSQAPEYGR